MFSASLTTGVVVGAGKTWSRQLTHCAAAALAEQLGTQLVGHAGFAIEPEPFAQTLRRVITEAD